MKGSEEKFEIGDGASTNETDFKRFDCRIEEVALGHKDMTSKVRDTAFPFTARVL